MLSRHAAGRRETNAKTDFPRGCSRRVSHLCIRIPRRRGGRDWIRQKEAAASSNAGRCTVERASTSGSGRFRPNASGIASFGRERIRVKALRRSDASQAVVEVGKSHGGSSGDRGTTVFEVVRAHLSPSDNAPTFPQTNHAQALTKPPRGLDLAPCDLIMSLTTTPRL